MESSLILKIVVVLCLTWFVLVAWFIILETTPFTGENIENSETVPDSYVKSKQLDISYNENILEQAFSVVNESEKILNVTKVIQDILGFDHQPEVDNRMTIERNTTETSKTKVEMHGEMGKAVIVDVSKLTPHEKEKYDEMFKRNAFNEYISNMISLHRSLPDKRHDSCLRNDYGENLPATSIIICFHNEAWSTLLRTVHSVFDRSPPSLIKEIILVDDGSDLDHLKQPLESYIFRYNKIRLIRLQQREGLIRARLVGFDAATAPVVTFLDSHVECLVGWLEPLLHRIKNSSENVVFPTIDNIDDLTFEYGEAVIDMVGAFHWKDMTFTWVKVPRNIWEIRREMAEPLRSPTMPGGIFSISREFFVKLGTYDSGLETWGGENLELSFKIWMCGGNLEMLPCSRVAHIFRSASPYSWPKGDLTTWRNVNRVATVWMDEYQQFFKDFYNIQIDIGDLRSRINLREDLNCKPFSWYASNILNEYMYIPTDALSVGEIRSAVTNACFDSLDHHGALKVYTCHGAGGNQNWYYTRSGYIRTEVRATKDSEGCLSFIGNQPAIQKCNTTDHTQLFSYTKDKMLMSVFNKTCITLDIQQNVTESLYLKPCDGSPRQKWILKTRNGTLL